MEVFEYILQGLGTSLGFNSIFLPLLLLFIFIVLASKYGISTFGIFAVFFFTIVSFASVGVIYIPMFSNTLFFIALLIVSLILGYLFYMVAKR